MIYLLVGIELPKVDDDPQPHTSARPEQLVDGALTKRQAFERRASAVAGASAPLEVMPKCLIRSGRMHLSRAPVPRGMEH